MQVSLEAVQIEKAVDTEVIFGQGTFNLLGIEELHRAVAVGAPKAEFGAAFCEASDNRLVRTTGNSSQLIDQARSNVQIIGAGHSFLVLLRGAYPIQVLSNIRNLSTTVTVIGATGNECYAIVARLPQGNALLGIVDGSPPARPETIAERRRRQETVRRIGYLEDIEKMGG
ncbi:MAG: adenosine-specific kinase [Gammaproteobacteria bacterium]